MRRMAASVFVLLAGFLCAPGSGQDLPARDEALRALRKAAEFYRSQVAKHGGYHFYYTEDLSYGRSEHGEGFTQVEVQRDATPGVGLAYLEAYEATGDRYYLEAAREAAHALVKGQLCSGGWDYFIEFDPARRPAYGYRADTGCRGPAESRPGGRQPVTNLDDNVTQGAIRLLMRVDQELGFQDKQVHDAARFALDSLLQAQYPNGAWPQRYRRFPDPKQFPVKRASYPESWSRAWPGADYQSHYTFNDNSILDAIDVMLEAARVYKEPQYMASAEKGGEFLLLAQMPEPQPGWAQQYDQEMHPAWARRFEPPSVTGGESQGVMQMLLVLYRETGNKKYLEPLPRALQYFRRSALPEAEKPSEIRARACRRGALCLARFYELRTNRPLYITKGTRVSVLDQPAITMNGYELSYSDESVITHYGVLVNGTRLDSIAREYEKLVQADPTKLRRPDKLHGLSPWSEGWAPVGSGAGPDRRAPARFQSAAELEPRVRAILSAMDNRGAWAEEGNIGRAGRIVSLFAAKDMVVTLGGKILSMKENDTLQVFAGPEAPKQRIIRSRTFRDNVEVLSAYLRRASR